MEDIYKFKNLLDYFRTLRIIYQKRVIGKVALNLYGNYTKFVIVSPARVGSTLLLSYLNYHSQIIVKDEIVREKNASSHYSDLSIIDYLKKKVYKKRPNKIKAVGFKYFYGHRFQEPELHQYLIRDKTIKIIHLKRKNLLRSYVSARIAETTKAWSKTFYQKKLSTKDKKIFVNIEEYKRYLERIKKHYKDTAENFKMHQPIEIYYEDLIENPVNTLFKIQSFLSVNPLELRTLLDKQNPEKLEELVINYEEIKTNDKEYFFEKG